ncbi:uncharacterized protein LOC121837419 [Ixodes scapularis]|uniref:uncharacterized protein LOC121837419 n=1 Tax=Ixodes scapularis TaxID=6945 RepID=UPI001C395553|nr:uncharacterized protein LOC121837419 [Ixodes scapularis]
MSYISRLVTGGSPVLWCWHGGCCLLWGVSFDLLPLTAANHLSFPSSCCDGGRCFCWLLCLSRLSVRRWLSLHSLFSLLGSCGKSDDVIGGLVFWSCCCSRSSRRSHCLFVTTKGTLNLFLQILSAVGCAPPHSLQLGLHAFSWSASGLASPHAKHTLVSGVGHTSMRCPTFPQHLHTS